ncbi:hypothetical protein DL93DRAFT_811791 [Clavulina sp. PMI_390]|nr:hypothetical protein DL93DRAFT_811791 [Clavulina sp. PMI_390]
MRFNYTLDAPSPVLQYLGSGWTPIQGADASNYRNNTAIRTSTKGDSLQFSFNGTGIWVYGSERSTNGNFDVIVDTSSWSTNSTAAVGQDQFQTLVFGVGNLTNGPHEITITNRGFGNGTAGGSFDVDWIKWEGALPDNSKHQVIRNSNAAFKYLPGPTWWSYGQDNQSFDGQLYYTQSSSAEFQFNFVGSSIELYGYLDTNHGNFSCSIDGVSRGTYSGYYPKNVYQQLICFGDNLDGGSHTISVQNLPLSANDGWFSIDYARLSGTTVCVRSSHLFDWLTIY